VNYPGVMESNKDAMLPTLRKYQTTGVSAIGITCFHGIKFENWQRKVKNLISDKYDRPEYKRL